MKGAALELHGVDSDIEGGAGFTREYGVLRVPTIVFLREGEKGGVWSAFPKAPHGGCRAQDGYIGQRAAY